MAIFGINFFSLICVPALKPVGLGLSFHKGRKDDREPTT